MNRNCCTNSVPYGYGGRNADTSVLPVRIIMSPTCSSRFLVGKKALSATERIIRIPYCAITVPTQLQDCAVTAAQWATLCGQMAGELDLSVDRGAEMPLGAQLAGRIRE